MKFVPREYQIPAAIFLSKNPTCSLLADPGTGKTAIVLSLLRGLKKLNPGYRTLVLGPKRVVLDVWPEEIEKWDQFRGLIFEVLHGTKKEERAATPADIHLLNVDGIKWASEHRLLNKYDALVVDESSKLKNWTSQRVLILKRYLGQFRRRHILTGSPMPQSLLDFFSQQYLIDLGETLGHSITSYRNRYFFDAAAPFQPYSIWKAREGALEEVLERISPFSYRLDGEKLLDLPDIQINDIWGTVPSIKDYRQRIKLAESAGAAFMLSRQLASGFLVNSEPYHSLKMEMLEALVDDLNGKSALVFFEFRSEGKEIARRFQCPMIYGGTSDTVSREVLRKWKAGELPLLALNPATTGHGLNLQSGGYHMIWFSLPTNQDNYYQAIRRLRRPGQASKTVFVHRLLMRETVDEALLEILAGKTEAQQKFLDGIKSA